MNGLRVGRAMRAIIFGGDETYIPLLFVGNRELK
jgi:hypothetical protein